MTVYQNPHAPSCPWHDITVMHGAPNIKWCEETLCGWISEPANTWSNLGYLIVGFIIIISCIKNCHERPLKLFGPVVFFMGLCSLIYHASNFYTTQVLDFIGMYFMVGWVIGMNLIRLEKLHRTKLELFNVCLAGVFTIAMHIMYLNEVRFQILILIAAGLCIITEVLAGRMCKVEYKWFFTAIGLLIVAFSFSIMDHKRIWCHPTEHGWFSQGHALWHWIGAIAMFAIYKHYSQSALCQPKDA